MNLSDVIVGFLLVIGVGSAIVSCIGVVVMDDAFDRLHFVSPVSTIAPAAIAAAIVVEEGFSASGIKSLLVAILMIATSPVLTHATARAARVRQFGHWRAIADEKVD